MVRAYAEGLMTHASAHICKTKQKRHLRCATSCIIYDSLRSSGNQSIRLTDPAPQYCCGTTTSLQRHAGILSWLATVYVHNELRASRMQRLSCHTKVQSNGKNALFCHVNVMFHLSDYPMHISARTIASGAAKPIGNVSESRNAGAGRNADASKEASTGEYVRARMGWHRRRLPHPAAATTCVRDQAVKHRCQYESRRVSVVGSTNDSGRYRWAAIAGTNMMERFARFGAKASGTLQQLQDTAVTVSSGVRQDCRSLANFQIHTPAVKMSFLKRACAAGMQKGHTDNLRQLRAVPQGDLLIFIAV
jgi:hypothetical protein